MAATLSLCESNGAGETLTHGITNCNMGDVDAANLNPVDYPVRPGNNTYEKYWRVEVTSMGGSYRILNIKVWVVGALGGAAVMLTNARTSGYVEAAYAQPVKTDSAVATQPMPSTVPDTANVGINGSLDGYLDAAGLSDYIVTQVQTVGTDTSGATTNLYVEYDEIA